MQGYASNHPWLTFFLALAGLEVVYSVGLEIVSPGTTKVRIESITNMHKQPTPVAAVTTAVAGLMPRYAPVISKWPRRSK